MTDHIKMYADYHGLDPERAGEVILTASCGNLEDLPTTLGGLHAMGVELNDTRETVVQKIRATMASYEGLKKYDEGLNYGDGLDDDDETARLCLKHSRTKELEKVLSWVEGSKA